MKLDITLAQLEWLLIEQKKITIAKCMRNSYYYNKETTDGSSKSLPIDEEKFKENGMTAKFPSDFEVLKKYLTE